MRWTALILLAVLVASCGGGIPTLDEPVGEAVLPDLIALPPADLHLAPQEDGTLLMRFTSEIVNAGPVDFVLRANRDGSGWRVQQEIPHSGGGGTLEDVTVGLVWGGDGHEHWHAERVATYRLVGRSEDGRTFELPETRTDTKVGFCFYDSHDILGTGPKEAVFSRHGCGHETETELRMGLSPGWSDQYVWTLPGQAIDITGLEDGLYRLVAEADEPRRFLESNTENNGAWVDIELYTDAQGLRWASPTATSPRPGDR